METTPSLAGQGEGSNPVNLKFRVPTFLVLLAVMGLALRATAAGLPIEILDTRNATRLSMTIAVGASGTNYAQRQTSMLDISDKIYSPEGAFLGEANASSFQVSAITTNMLHLFPVMGIFSYATNEIWFSPVTSTTTTLEFERYMTGGHHRFDNFSHVSLRNITSGQEVLNRQWDGYGVEGTLIENSSVSFNAGDTYKLFMVAWTIEDTVGPWTVTTSSLRVSGFDPISVPEPTAASVVGLGMLAWVVRRKIGRKRQYE